ncbi:hypothetical protein DMENIID0001_001660 [Sergentomyia squamirostris]
MKAVNSACVLGLLLIAITVTSAQRFSGRTRDRDSTSSSSPTHEAASSGDSSILVRLYDRLATIVSLDEQLLKRLEALEYK